MPSHEQSPVRNNDEAAPARLAVLLVLVFVLIAGIMGLVSASFMRLLFCLLLKSGGDVLIPCLHGIVRPVWKAFFGKDLRECATIF